MWIWLLVGYHKILFGHIQFLHFKTQILYKLKVKLWIKKYRKGFVIVTSQKLCIMIQGCISFYLVCLAMLNELMSKLRDNLKPVHADSIGWLHLLMICKRKVNLPLDRHYCTKCKKLSEMWKDSCSVGKDTISVSSSFFRGKENRSVFC